MKYNPDIHHRRSIRLKGYDYSHAGLYFITICTQDRLCLFGKIENGAMVLNDAGKMANKWWNELKHKYQNIRLHEQIVMPNHFHGIIEIIDNTLTHVDPASVGADLCVCPNSGNDSNKGEHTGSPLHSMVQWFKTMMTNEYIRGVKQNNWPRFDKKLWQRNYYEHIIRSEKSYLQISEYIQTNPLKWQEDKYHVPDNIRK